MFQHLHHHQTHQWHSPLASHRHQGFATHDNPLVKHSSEKPSLMSILKHLKHWREHHKAYMHAHQQHSKRNVQPPRANAMTPTHTATAHGNHPHFSHPAPTDSFHGHATPWGGQHQQPMFYNTVSGPNQANSGGTLPNPGQSVRNVTDQSNPALNSVQNKGFNTAYSAGQMPPASDNAAVFTSQNGQGYFEKGTISLTDSNGRVHTFRADSGGKGNGALPPGTYTITNPEPNIHQKGMVQDNIGYKFHLNDKDGRTDLRIHPNSGNGTHGCLGIIGNGSTQQEFNDVMTNLINQNGGQYRLVVQ